MVFSTRNAARDASATRGPKTESGRTRSSRSADRGGRVSRPGVDFETFASSLRRALVPASPLEVILTDRLILAAWRLQLASMLEFDTALAGDDLPPLSRETQDAERSLEKSLELLETSRAERLGRPYPYPTPEPADYDTDSDNDSDDFAHDLDADFSNEWPALPEADIDLDADDLVDDTDLDLTPRWQDRLVFDFNVSETSPVVKGTWVTVGHVVSLIVDGWNWSDVLRTHPELTEDDIRTCLAYTVEHDNGDGF